MDKKKKQQIRDSVATWLEDDGYVTELGTTPDDTVIKAGVVPFVWNKRIKRYEYLVIKPRADKQDVLGLPPFQICKGTRMFKDNTGSWEDMRGGMGIGMACESLIMTAFREGVEELGIDLDNIHNIIDLGVHEYTSATTGKQERVQLYGLALHTKEELKGKEHIEETIDSRQWMSLANFLTQGRRDYHRVLWAIESQLAKMHGRDNATSRT